MVGVGERNTRLVLVYNLMNQHARAQHAVSGPYVVIDIGCSEIK